LASSLFTMAKGFFGGEAEPKPKPVPVKKTAHNYHSVTIAPCPRACAAALALGERRFLSREAPVLPLKKCDRAECQCRYQHYDDRRKGPRRGRDLGVAVESYDGADARQKVKRGRRKTDR
jgi:hypothetical protein